MSPTLRRRKSRKAAEDLEQSAGDRAEPSVEVAAERADVPAASATAEGATEPAPPAPPDTALEGTSAGPTGAAQRPAGAAARPRPERRRTLAHLTPVLLLRAAHPRQALITAVGLAVAAAISGRDGREVALVLATVLVGQAVLGWHNDLVDQRRDATRLPSGKPIADGYLDPGTAWFALICGVLLVVPLSVANGVAAGCAYLASVAVGLLSNVVLRRSWLSWLPWAVAFALYPFFLSYGGWAGDSSGSAPQPVMVVLAALLGIGVHVLTALPGLVADHEDGYRHLALRIALRIGATRLLVIALAWTVLALVALLVVGDAVGLRR